MNIFLFLFIIIIIIISSINIMGKLKAKTTTVLNTALGPFPCQYFYATVSAAPPIPNNGGHATLSCHLHTYESCEKVSSTDLIHLSWVDEKGSKLQESAERQIQNISSCHITITESLLHHEETTWRCQVTNTRGDWIKAVATYIFGRSTWKMSRTR